MKYSVIVPVYNAEKTLDRCLNSIRQQTYTNWELLLIDDGSDDNSFSICSDYSKRDTRIKVFQQQNSGPSAARNIGLEQATGEWVCFVDSDDFISNNYLKEMDSVIRQRQELEMIFLGFHKLGLNGEITDTIIPEDNGHSGVELAADLSKQGIFGFTWIKIFRKDKIGEIRFHRDLNLFEDEVFTCEVMQRCRETFVVKKALYNYACSEESLIRKICEDYCRKCDEVYLAWKKLLAVQNQWKEYGDYLENRANFFVSRCRYYGLENDVKLKSYFSSLKKTTFFEEHTHITHMDKLIMADRYIQIWLEKKKYQIKSEMASHIKRRTKNESICLLPCRK